MINITLLKKELSSSWKTLLGFLVILTMYIVIMVYMYSPEMSGVLNAFSDSMPEIFAAFGMANIGEGLLGFCIQYLYGFILFVFPAIYIILTASKVVCRYVDTGSMAYLLATPNKRKKIVLTQWIVLNILIMVLVLYIIFCGIASAELFFPGELNIQGFVLVNLGLWMLYFFIANLLFCLSCIFNETDKFNIAAGSILFFSFICQSVTNMGTELSFLKYFTFLTLFNPANMISNFQSQIFPLSILVFGGIVFSVLGISIFEKRDLPL